MAGILGALLPNIVSGVGTLVSGIAKGEDFGEALGEGVSAFTGLGSKKPQFGAYEKQIESDRAREASGRAAELKLELEKMKAEREIAAEERKAKAEEDRARREEERRARDDERRYQMELDKAERARERAREREIEAEQRKYRQLEHGQALKFRGQEISDLLKEKSKIRKEYPEMFGYGYETFNPADYVVSDYTKSYVSDVPIMSDTIVDARGNILGRWSDIDPYYLSGAKRKPVQRKKKPGPKKGKKGKKPGPKKGKKPGPKKGKKN